MTIVSRPSAVSSLLGGSIELPVHACGHEPAIEASPWVGEPGTSGRVAVVGAGKMGLPLAAEIDAFLRVVRYGGRPVVDAEDGLWAVAVATSLLDAAAQGAAIDLTGLSSKFAVA